MGSEELALAVLGVHTYTTRIVGFIMGECMPPCPFGPMSPTRKPVIQTWHYKFIAYP